MVLFTGKLVESCGKDCLFSAEYHSGQLALRDHTGAYLSPIGSKAVLKSRSQTVTKDELFSLEDSLPQASFVAALNSRYVSVKQGTLCPLTNFPFKYPTSSGQSVYVDNTHDDDISSTASSVFRMFVH